MILIKIGKRKYKGIYRWSDITLQRFCDLAAIPIPAGYEAFILADGKFNPEDQKSINTYCDIVNKLSDKELKEDFPDYYQKVIQCLSDIPEKVLENSDSTEVERLYEYYFKPFVVSLLYHVPMMRFAGQIVEYEPDEQKVFRLGLSFYYLPRSIYIDGQEIPLANEPIITYSEASDIFRDIRITKDDVHRLTQFMAIYCRKRGEKYKDSLVLKRQEKFMQVPMSVVWNVFFYTIRYSNESIQIIRLFGSLPKQMHELRNQVRIYKDLAAVL